MVLQEKEIKSKLTGKFYKILVSNGALTNLSDDKVSKIMLELSHMKIPMVTQILALFLGQLGIHRFYNGNMIGGGVFVVLTTISTIIIVATKNYSLAGLNAWICVAGLIDGNILSKKIAKKNYERILDAVK
jgi:TM2 domain